MKKQLTGALLLCAASFLPTVASAEELTVPVRWERAKNAARGQFENVAVARDTGKFVFAFTAAQLQEVSAEKGGISVYWNCDNNKMSGRFVKDFGADIQLNISLAERKVDLIFWQDESKRVTRSLNEGNLFLDLRENTLLLVLAADTLKGQEIAERSGLRINLAAPRRQRYDAIAMELDFSDSTLRKEKRVSFPGFRHLPAAFSHSPPDGKGIAVPVRWKCGEENFQSGRFRSIGFFQDETKYVFGFTGPVCRPGASILIYWNCDGDSRTGRFPKSLGVDLQLNVNLEKKNIQAILWENDRSKRQMTLYEDDFLIEETSGVLFLALRAEALKQVKIAEQSYLRVNHAVGNARLDSVEFTLNTAAKDNLFLPERMNFIRFGSKQDVEHKPSVAIPLRGTKKGISVWMCGAERFREEEATPDHAAPVEAFELKGAAGENEYLFFAVETEKPSSGPEVLPAPLRSDSGTEIAPGCLDIRYADYVENDRGERYTDVLLPSAPGRPSRRHFLVLSCRIPRDGKPGIYAGQLPLRINGAHAGTIPVRLEVYGFQLPEKPFFPTAFSVKQSHIAAKFPDRAVRERIYEKMLDQCERLRCGPRLLSTEPKLSLEGKTLKVDWKEYEGKLDRYLQRFSILQITPAQLGSHELFYRWNSLLGKKYKDAGDPEFQSVWAQFVRAYHQWFQAKGILDRSLFIIWDEPYSRWNDIMQSAEIVRRNAPDLPIGIFIDKYSPILEKYIDIWLLPFSGLAKTLASGNPANKRLWLYNSGGMNDFRIRAADLRAFYHLAYRCGIEGYLSSETNMIAQSGFRAGYFFNHYPQHCWMYVSEDGTDVYDSWRQLLINDGLDDFDYLSLYRELREKHGEREPGWLREALPFFRRDGKPEFKMKTIAEWNAVRDRIAREIVRLKQNK